MTMQRGAAHEDTMDQATPDGSIQEIHEIPPALRAKYKEVFEIEPLWLIKAAAEHQNGKKRRA